MFYSRGIHCQWLDFLPPQCRGRCLKCPSLLLAKFSLTWPTHKIISKTQLNRCHNVHGFKASATHVYSQHRVSFNALIRHLMRSRSSKVALLKEPSSTCKHSLQTQIPGRCVCTCMLRTHTQSSSVCAALPNSVMRHSSKTTKLSLARTKCAIASPTCPSYILFLGISRESHFTAFARFYFAIHGKTGSFAIARDFTVPCLHTILQTQ